MTTIGIFKREASSFLRRLLSLKMLSLKKTNKFLIIFYKFSFFATGSEELLSFYKDIFLILKTFFLCKRNYISY